MKLNKLVAALSAVTMLGSLAIAVPASAKTVTVTDSELTATSAFQVRGKSAEMTTKQAVAAKGATETIEMTYADTENKKAWFGAVYTFDIPEGVTVTSATLTIPRSDNYKGVAFTAVPLTADQALTADNVFNYVADANITSAATTATLNNGDGQPLSGNITSLFNGTTPNAVFVYKANQADANARKVMGTATLTLSYTYEEPDAPVAQIGETKYASFAEAFEAAATGDTIKLLDDVELNERYVLDSGTSGNGTYKKNISQLTIDGDDNTVTINAASNFKFLFESNGKQLTFKNMIIDNKREYIINAKAASKITLDGVTAAAPILNSAANANLQNGWVNATDLNVTNAADGVSIYTSTSSLPGSVEVALTDALAAQYDVENGVLKTKAAEPETKKVSYAFTSTLEMLSKKDAVNVKVSADGYDESASVDIKSKLPVINGNGDLMLGIVLTVPAELQNVRIVIE